MALWRHALDHLADGACVGLEAPPERIADYAGWGFRSASPTTRWRRPAAASAESFAAAPAEALLASAPPSLLAEQPGDPSLVDARGLPDAVVQAFDAAREPSPRPHFLSDWLHHPAGDVLALVDQRGRLPWLRAHPALFAARGQRLAHRPPAGHQPWVGGAAAAGPVGAPSR